MKATGIISALIFAHAAFAQASDSSSVAVASATDSATVSPPAASATGSAAGAASSSASEASASPGGSSSGSASASASGTKAGTKSASSAASPSAAATTTSSVDAGKSGGSATSVPLAATSAVSSSSANPLIPDSASTGCQTFLKQLNADTALSGCFTPLLNALSAFTSGSASASALTKTLNNVCASSACSAPTMRSKLTDFGNACSAEIKSSSDSTVLTTYDVLYTIYPFKSAICTKDQDTQAYCLLNIGTGSSVGNTTQNLATGPSEAVKYAEDHLANTLTSSRRRAQSMVVPNTDTFRNTGLMYLFTSPDMNSGELCTSCTQQILSKYIAWESATPHALGLANSPLLGGQGELWSAIQEKCPASFLSEVSNIAGVASASDINGAAPALTGGMVSILMGALAAFALI